jgi:hypothetical protein
LTEVVETTNLKLSFDYWMDKNNNEINSITITDNYTYKAHYGENTQTYTVTWYAGPNKYENTTVDYNADYTTVNGKSPSWNRVGYYEENNNFKDSNGNYYAIRVAASRSSSASGVTTDLKLKAEMYTLGSVSDIDWSSTNYISEVNYNNVNVLSTNSFKASDYSGYDYFLRGIKLTNGIFKNGIQGVEVSYKYIFNYKTSACDAILCVRKGSDGLVADNGKSKSQLEKNSTESGTKTLKLYTKDKTGTIFDNDLGAPAGRVIRDKREFYFGYYEGAVATFDDWFKLEDPEVTFTNIKFKITYFKDPVNYQV